MVLGPFGIGYATGTVATPLASIILTVEDSNSINGIISAQSGYTIPAGKPSYLKQVVPFTPDGMLGWMLDNSWDPTFTLCYHA